MRILFAGLALPYPPMNGHRLRTWAMVRALADAGHRISLVSFAEHDEISEGLGPLREACSTVDLVPTPLGSGREALEPLRRLQALASLLPYGAWKFRSSEFTRQLERRLCRQDVDILLCDGVYNMQNLPSGSRVPVVLNKDDVAHVIVRRYLALERRVALRAYGELEARKIARWEAVTAARAHLVLACSEIDRLELLALCPTARIAVVPNVVDTEHYTPGASASDARTVLFQGGMDWHPNRDAVEFFVAEVLPLLRRRAPGVRFRVAGRDPSEPFRARFAGIDDVEFTGTVPDMRAEIVRATVCVVPLRIGSGTRLKILEAAAMARPIVSTRLGAEGLSFVDAKDICLADDPASLARGLAALLADESMRRSLGDAARRRVEMDYSQPVLRTALDDALRLGVA
jgi:glycosyltransferase involved in cell wall biosynthesis